MRVLLDVAAGRRDPPAPGVGGCVAPRPLSTAVSAAASAAAIDGLGLLSGDGRDAHRPAANSPAATRACAGGGRILRPRHLRAATEGAARIASDSVPPRGPTGASTLPPVRASRRARVELRAFVIRGRSDAAAADVTCTTAAFATHAAVHFADGGACVTPPPPGRTRLAHACGRGRAALAQGGCPRAMVCQHGVIRAIAHIA